MRSDFALPKNFANQNDEDECVVTETSATELWEDKITAKDGVNAFLCAVHMLQLSVHDFFKVNSRAKEVLSNVRNVANKTHK